jgi:hypothetical protein
MKKMYEILANKNSQLLFKESRYYLGLDNVVFGK